MSKELWFVWEEGSRGPYPTLYYERPQKKSFGSPKELARHEVPRDFDWTKGQVLERLAETFPPPENYSG